ncbi:hypothetical protein MLD38_013520 [Melastoma candidum]|uniref:Uncharacterized protein n=1 Tax=Melastoma candidum TaxID=119954 RepID=A0ACB9R9T5_9MYRT|nr:hypothetical protein MLD38_013520 [Melastoma candidum]
MYAITTGHAEGEEVSPYVATGIDYFGLLLENGPVFGKNTTYQMESWHVSQSLHTPTAIFRPFIDPGSNTPASHGLSSDQPEDTSSTVDPLFSVDLYAACCQLLYPVLKHHKRGCLQEHAPGTDYKVK